jgi:hypothetical protein
MSQQFACTIDAKGNISARSGWVICPRHGTKFEVADLAISASEYAGNRGFRGSRKAMFLGGSGENLKVTGPNTVVPVGCFPPGATSGTWEGIFSTGVTIILAGDGTATIEDATDVIATAGATTFTIAPEGNFTSTSYGQTLNGGTPFTLAVSWEGGLTGTGYPLAGDVWLEVTETSAGSGEVASVSGLKFGDAMPSPSGAMTPVLIAESDGSGGLVQYQEGPIIWGTGTPWVTITAADFLALDPPDAATLYDIYDP